MLLTLFICSFAALYAAACWWALKVKKIDLRHWAGASLLGLWLAGVGGKFLFDAAGHKASTNPMDTTASLAWPGPQASTATGETNDGTKATARSAAAGKPVVGSVDSMIGPLKARLEKHPQDPNGWALLAQSYAYMGDDAEAKRAIARAVALGVDEKMLRDRVAAVGRSRTHSNWISEALDK